MPEFQSLPDAESLSLSHSVLARTADPRVLELIVFPTEHCNFRCTYCYEDFKIGHIRPEMVLALKRLISTRVPELSRLRLSWFGGEPTLALPTVLDLTAYAREALRDCRGDSAVFQSGMTTNGFRLTQDNFGRLCSAGVTDYQITLDGPREVHNRRRLRADGSATFDVIWENLLGMAASVDSLPPEVRVELRLHYDGESVDSLEDIVDAICAELLPAGLFHVKFHALERLGGAGDEGIALASRRDHDIVRNLMARIAKADGAAMSHVANDIEDYVCYAAKANSFVVRADGRIGKCTVALNDPRNDVGHLNLDGTISWNEGRMAPWLEGIKTGDRNLLACPLGGLSAWPETLARIEPTEAARPG